MTPTHAAHSAHIQPYLFLFSLSLPLINFSSTTCEREFSWPRRCPAWTTLTSSGLLCNGVLTPDDLKKWVCLFHKLLHVCTQVPNIRVISPMHLIVLVDEIFINNLSFICQNWIPIFFTIIIVFF